MCSQWVRVRGPNTSGVVDAGDLAELVQLMAGLDHAHRPRMRAHHQALRYRTTRVELHTLQQLTIGHARGGEEAVVAEPYLNCGQLQVQMRDQ